MKRITVFLALVLLFSAAPATAHTDLSPTAGRFWITNIEYTYSYFVRVCDVGYPSNGDPEARIIDALNEWNEIGGELSFAWQDISDASCDYEMANSPLPWIKITPAGLASPALGTTNNYEWVDGSGKIYNCLILMDSHLGSYTQGARSDIGVFDWYFGSSVPSSSQVDFESALVHEIGHCLARYGHSSAAEGTNLIFYSCLNPTCGDPRGIEKDEIGWGNHDWHLYADLYGTTH